MTDTTNNNNDKSTTIGPNDVLLGRGGLTNCHDGNRRFRTIVVDHQPEYLGARKKEKAVIARRIVAIIHSNGGRFLKRADDCDAWVEVPDKRAREKTSQALREGLDVRNRTIRPSKMARRYSDFSGEQQNENDDANKRMRVASGWVTAVPTLFPAVVSVQGEIVPDLQEEQQSALEKTMAQVPQIKINKSSVEHVCEV